MAAIRERREVAFYESVYIARPDISAAQVEALTQRLTEIIETSGGRVTKNEYWGLKNLAYRIKKNRKGHYSLLNIDAPSGAVGEYERNMRLSEDVLRYLTVRVDELEENPSVMMTRGSRDDRGRGRGRGFGGRDGGRPQAAQPTGQAAKPTEQAAKPTEQAAQPTEQAAEPTEQAAQPTEQAAEPTVQAAKPTEQAAEPTEQAAEPTEQAAEPTEQAAEPTEQAAQPTEQAAEPTEAKAADETKETTE